MKIKHVYYDYTPTKTADKRRYAMAKSTWDKLKWDDGKVLRSDLSRFLLDGNSSLPYIRDVIDAGAKGLSDKDVVVFTKGDTCLANETIEEIKKAMSRVAACYCIRREIRAELKSPLSDINIKTGLMYKKNPADLFAFTVQWWNKNRKNFPSMVLGRERWDTVITTLIDESGMWPDTVIKDIVYHEMHDAFWCEPDIKVKLVGNRVNYDLAVVFFKKRGLSHEKFGFK
ncbi:MAG: hypothetical protein WCI55_08070 [Armatimonadota bacterium]